MHQKRRDHYGAELREADLAHAEGVLKEELARRKWTATELGRQRKGDPGKVEVASALRAHHPDIELDRATA
jgi:hypothetical protein